MSEINLAGIAGSIRKDSFNKALLHNAQNLSDDNVNIDILKIDNLPFFNQDVESSNFPEAATEFKNRIKEADGIIISTPEYNRSIPGVLKNAIDWSSRPPTDNAWAGQRVLVLGASIGPISTAIAQSHLKHSLLYLDCLVMGQPEFYLGNAHDKFNDKGKLTDEQTRDFLKETLHTFIDFIGKQ
ncbi:MAG TPA: NADPH-dependent FMN reductase [Balneolaceae bacterium]|nr:NADPH-dependent FMN reductase [Balneolaceae bacterium]